MGATPWDVEVSADGSRVYVTDYGQNQLSIIDATSLARTTTAVGTEPGFVAVTPDDDSAYVSSYGNNAISVVDPASASQVGTLAGFSRPWALAIDGNQYLYVFEYGGGARPIRQVNLSTGAVDDSVAITGYAWSASLSADGATLYAPYPAQSKLVVIQTAGMTVASEVATPGQPRFAVTSPDQASVFVTSNVTSGPAQLLRIGTSSLTVDDTWPIAPNNFMATGLAVSPDGRTVYVAVQAPQVNNVSVNPGQVLAIDSATGIVDDSILVGIDPIDLDINPAGDRLYVTNGASNTLSVISLSAPVPPPPPAPEPATPPRDVVAVAGDASASVSWAAPASTGSYPASHYLVTSTPSGRTCLAPAPDLTCEVTGLANGMEYTFTVKALTGAGWSAASTPSNAVVPRASARPSIVITGSRDGKRIEVSGSTSGFGMGAILNPWVRLAGQSKYTQGSAQVLVSMNGTFSWSRTTGKRASVYMQTPDGSVRSNTVTIPAG